MSGHRSVQAICDEYGISPGGKSEGLTIEDVGKVLAPFSGTPDVFTPVLKVSDALWSNLGICGKKRFSQEFCGAYPLVAARFLQALGHHQCSVTALWDTTTGCFIEVKQPADLLSLRGTFAADIIEIAPDAVRVDVAAETKGQLFDWGKSRRLIDQIFDRTRFYLTKM